MNKEYLKELFNEYQDTIIENGYDMESVEDLEDLMIDYITSNMLYDFNIDIDKNKLFSKGE